MTAGVPARSGRRLAIVLVVLAVAAAVVAGVLILRPAPPPTGRVPAPPAQPLLVSVGHTGPESVNQGYPTSITVRALGERPIASLELWLGSRLLAEAANTGGTPIQVARWTWTPAEAGPAVLVARATDDRGRQAQSPPLRLTVSADPPMFQKVSQVKAVEGETAAAAAIRAGGRTDDLATWNEDLDPNQPLSAGFVVFVPFDPQPAPKPSTPEVVDLTASDFGLRAVTAPLPGTAELVSWKGAGDPAPPLAEGTGLFVPPTVEPTVSDCTIELKVTSSASNATGLAVYGLGPTSSTFTRVGTLPPSSGGSTYETEASAGTYLFDVSTYDGTTEQQGDLVEVDVPAECGEPGWDGPAHLSDGLLIVEGDVDRAYLYLSRDGGPWVRVPSEAGEFVERVDGKLDFSDHLPADVDTGAIDLEAWGWKGGSLLDLGKGHRDAAASPPPAGSAPPPAGGAGTNTVSSFDFTSLDWIGSKFAPGSGELVKEALYLRDGELVVWTSTGKVITDLTRDFRWQSNSESVDSVVWQVAAFPMSPDLAPSHPGVLLQKTLPVTDGTKSGEFEIDFRSIFAPPLEAKIGDTLGGEVVGQISLAGLGGLGATPKPSPTPGQPGSPAGQVGSATGTPDTYAASWLLQTFTPSVLYVRAIAMDGTSVAGPVSNFVKFTVTDETSPFTTTGSPPTGPQPTNGPSAALRPYVLFMEFVAPANANPAFSTCVMVTGIDLQKGGGGYGLEPGDFYCYAAPSKSGWSLADAFDDFVDFVADAWDQIANAWSWLQQQLASAVAKYSGCSAIAGGSFCEGMVKVGISVALASVGIPPSLPNTEELMQMAKGELKDALVDIARKSAKAALGYDPCDALYLAKQGLGAASCEDIAAQLVDELGAQLDDWKSQQATAATGAMQLPGVNVVLHPWGQLRPPKFRVTIARNVNVPLPATGTCSMRLSMTAYRPKWTHDAYIEGKGWTTVTEDVQGQPFAPLYLQIPDPASSEGAFEIPQTLPKDASVYQAIFAAMNQKVAIIRDYYLTETTFWREPNNPTKIYKPGQGYVYMVDQSNRAWVLTLNGTIVKGSIGPGPGTNCFNAVTAYGIIPLEDLGSPCVPTYGFYWQTKDVPFAGDIAQQWKCQLDYQKVAAW